MGARSVVGNARSLREHWNNLQESKKWNEPIYTSHKEKSYYRK